MPVDKSKTAEKPKPTEKPKPAEKPKTTEKPKVAEKPKTDKNKTEKYALTRIFLFYYFLILRFWELVIWSGSKN